MEAHVTAQVYTQLAQTLLKEFDGKRYWSSILPIIVDEKEASFSFSALVEVGHTGLVHKVTPIWWDITGVITDFDFEIFESFIRYESAISRL